MLIPLSVIFTLFLGLRLHCNGFSPFHAGRHVSPRQQRNQYQKITFSPQSEHSSDNDISTKLKKSPNFPGAVTANSTDISTLIYQTNQESPANAILGKPSICRCRHGFTQAFSLDPVPFAQNRLNSGLLKLTCPLLVNSIDILEDQGFMNDVNQMLQRELTRVDGDENNQKLTGFLTETHLLHSQSRKKLLSTPDDDSTQTEHSSYQIIEHKLGKQGAEYFMKAGVAGANPHAEKPDVKCLHAWMADYIFRKIPDHGSTTSSDEDSDVVFPTGMTKHHPIGELIKDALFKGGVSISGNDNCHLVCSGIQTLIQSKDGQVVSVPNPRNKQRKRSVKTTERRRRLKQKKSPNNI